MKYLISGDMGFVGGHLTQKLKDWVGYDLKRGQDIRNIQQLDLFFEQHQPEIVIHMAALAGVRQGESYPQEYYSTNIFGTQNIVNMCQKYGVKHLINFSSSSVFGLGNPPVKEEDKKMPLGVYGISKLAAEHICQTSSIPQVTIIRPFTVYGLKGRPEQVVYKWINQIKKNGFITKYGDGSKSNRGYVFVDDLVEGVLSVIKHAGEWEYEDFNLGGQEVVYLDDLVSYFQEFSPIPFEIKEFSLPAVDPIGNSADITKARMMLGFDPPERFKDNLKVILQKEFNV